MNQYEIIHKALENLQMTTGITGTLAEGEEPGIDNKVVLTIDGWEHKYKVEVKKEFRTFQLPALYTLANKGLKIIVIAEKLFPRTKEALREHGIPYLEANGNLFIRDQGAYVWTDVNKPINGQEKKENRAFAKTGSKLIFQFLLDEDWLNKPYRKIAAEMGTGIGNITNIIRGLKQGGFLIRAGKNQYKLTNKKELFHKWMTAFEQKLKPSIKVGRFRFLVQTDFTNWKKINLRNNKTWWGGEPAGDLFTDYLKPKELTLYTIEARADLIKNYRLVPDDQGHIQVFQKFWHYIEVNDNVVPPLLVYADLVNTGDPRCIETAQKIYDELLADKF